MCNQTFYCYLNSSQTARLRGLPLPLPPFYLPLLISQPQPGTPHDKKVLGTSHFYALRGNIVYFHMVLSLSIPPRGGLLLPHKSKPSAKVLYPSTVAKHDAQAPCHGPCSSPLHNDFSGLFSGLNSKQPHKGAVWGCSL